jgi:hypothetical protein
MSFNIAEYADQIANAEHDRVDRDFLEAGTHVIKIQGTVCVQSQNTGNNLIILEAVIESSTSQAAGDYVKHIWQLSGCDRWKVARNLGQLKTVVAATLPASIDSSVLTGDIVSRAFNEDLMIDALIKVVVKQKTSKNDAKYLDYSFIRYATTETPEPTAPEFPEEPPF